LFFVPQLAATIIYTMALEGFFFVVFLLLAKVRARAPSKQEKNYKEEPLKETLRGSSL